MAHPWHDIPLNYTADGKFAAFIEIPKGSKIKYELDKDTGLLKVDRILFSAVHYPANYGFLPQTYCDDGDALDVLVLGQEAVVPMCIMQARAIGFMQMRDEKGLDDKIIAVHVDDPAFAQYTHIDQLMPHTLLELRRFFEDYKALENKVVTVRDFQGPENAVKVVTDAMEGYRQLRESQLEP